MRMFLDYFEDYSMTMVHDGRTLVCESLLEFGEYLKATILRYFDGKTP